MIETLGRPLTYHGFFTMGGMPLQHAVPVTVFAYGPSGMLIEIASALYAGSGLYVYTLHEKNVHVKGPYTVVMMPETLMADQKSISQTYYVGPKWVELIGTGYAAVSMPVSGSADVEILRGDSYKDERSLLWRMESSVQQTLGLISQYTLHVGKIKFTVEYSEPNELRLQLSGKDTESIASGIYGYSIRAVSPNGDYATVVMGRMRVKTL